LSQWCIEKFPGRLWRVSQCLTLLYVLLTWGNGIKVFLRRLA